MSYNPTKVKKFQLAAIFLGISFIIFFALAFVLVLAGTSNQVIDYSWGRVLIRLVRWGHLHGGGEMYELMIATIYIVWGIFIVKAAKQPLNNKIFMDFTMFGNIAHFGVMFIMGIVIEGELLHLVGDVLMGWFALAIFIYFWLPLRHMQPEQSIN